MTLAEEELSEVDLVDSERAERGQPPKRQVTIGRARELREFTAAVKKIADVTTNAKEKAG